MKRTIIFYLLLCLVAPIAMEAKKKPFGNGLYWELTDDGTLIISGNGAMPDFNYDDSRPKVKAPWYKKGHFIKHVIIEDGITSIGAFSFYAYKGHYKGMQIIDHAYRNLQSVTLSSSVQDIGNVAFKYCESLSTVSINSKNTIGINDIHEHVIGMGAFADCDALVSIEIPAHITIIDQNAFRDCHNLKRVVMPNTVNIIERWAFDGCHNLSDLSIPNSVKEIGQHAFRGCKGPFIIPNSVKKIGSEAFAKCEGFVSINLPSSIEEIGSGAFKECKNLSTILIPSSVKVIGDNAFALETSYDEDKRKYTTKDPFTGNLLQVPNFILEGDALQWGISKQSIDNYKNSIRDNSGKIVLAYNKDRNITKINNSNYYLVEEGVQKGIIEENGAWLIPLGNIWYSFVEIVPDKEKYVKVKTAEGFYGIMNLDGKEIISTSRGYTSIGDYDSTKGTFAFTKKGYTGVCDAQGKEISLTKLPPTANDIISRGGYASAVELMNGSKKYYKVSKSGRYGLTDSEGKVIIPAEMEALEQAGTGFLRFKLNGFWGIVNYAGKILIDTDRGYTKIGDYVSFTKRFAYEMDGWKGECNNLGVQISKIKVNKTQQTVNSNSSSSKTSNDLATFDLKGNVRKCIIGNDTREFDRNGKLIAGRNENITYDTQGRIISILIGEDVLGGGHKYEYDNSGRVKVESVVLSLLGVPAESRTQNYYDTNGRVVRCIVTTVGRTGESDVTYSDYIIDNHGNWISRKKDGSTIETRTIEYY